MSGLKMKKKRDQGEEEGRRVGAPYTLGLVQMAMEDDPEANVSKAVAMVREASRGGASIVCLPELFPYRYFPQEGGPAHAEPIPRADDEAPTRRPRANLKRRTCRGIDL